MQRFMSRCDLDGETNRSSARHAWLPLITFLWYTFWSDLLGSLLPAIAFILTVGRLVLSGFVMNLDDLFPAVAAAAGGGRAGVKPDAAYGTCVRVEQVIQGAPAHPRVARHAPMVRAWSDRGGDTAVVRHYPGAAC